MNSTKTIILSSLVFFFGNPLFAWKVTLPPNPDPAVKNAEKELNKYCGKLIAGKQDNTEFVLKINAKLAQEEWQVRAKGDRTLELIGGSSRGVLYAVYHYLEDCCGIRFLSGDAEYIPSLNQLPVKDVNLTGKPAFRIRELPRVFLKDGGEFASKRRLNGHSWFPIAPEHGGSIGYGSPAPCHTFSYYISYDKYGKSHPEYFAQTRSGKRAGGPHGGQPCLSNPEVRKLMLENLRAYIRRDREKYKNNRNGMPVVYSVTQNDNQTYCLCGKCKALAAKYGNTQSGIMLDLLNELANGISKEYPDVILEFFAYQYSEPVAKNIKVHPNIHVRLCDTRGNLVAPISDKTNQSIRTMLNEWGKLAKISLWDYACSYDYPYDLPAPSEFTYQEDYRFLRRVTEHIFAELSSSAYPDAIVYKYYLLSRFMENPDLDFKKESEEFANLYYGKAGKLFLQYRELLWKSANAKKSYIAMYPMAQGVFGHLDFETVKKAQELMDEGRRLLVNDPVLLERWNNVALALDRATLVLQVNLTQQYRRAGGKPGTFPFDFKKILERAESVHLAYVDKYIVKQAVGNYLQKQAVKTVSGVRKYYSKLKKNLNLPETVYQIPEQFRSYPADQVYAFYAPQMTSRTSKIVDQEDPTSPYARSVVLYHSEKKPAGEYAFPLYAEFYRWDLRGGNGIGRIQGKQLPDSKWHWVKIGRINNLYGSSMVIFPGWYHVIGVSDAAGKEPANFICWAHLKAEGNGYRKTDTSKMNTLKIDAMVLVRESVLEKAKAGEPAFKVNGAAYRVPGTGKQWGIEYSRVFNKKVQDELGSAYYWKKHAKYSWICGFARDITMKCELPYPGSIVSVEAEVCNYEDARLRKFEVQISYDGRTYQTICSQDFKGGTARVSGTAGLKPQKTVWIRFVRKSKDNVSDSFRAVIKEITVRFCGTR